MTGSVDADAKLVGRAVQRGELHAGVDRDWRSIIFARLGRPLLSGHNVGLASRCQFNPPALVPLVEKIAHSKKIA